MQLIVLVSAAITLANASPSNIPKSTTTSVKKAPNPKKVVPTSTPCDEATPKPAVPTTTPCDTPTPRPVEPTLAPAVPTTTPCATADPKPIAPTPSGYGDAQPTAAPLAQSSYGAIVSGSESVGFSLAALAAFAFAL
jgi:hypothetical protein